MMHVCMADIFSLLQFAVVLLLSMLCAVCFCSVAENLIIVVHSFRSVVVTHSVRCVTVVRSVNCVTAACCVGCVILLCSVNSVF